MKKLTHKEFRIEPYLEPFNKTWNDITINADSDENCDKLIRLLENAENEFKIKISSEVVTMIYYGKIGDEFGAFDEEKKAIKISPLAVDKNIFEDVFIHEYCHAMDFRYDIYLDFLELFKELLVKVDRELVYDIDSIEKYGCEMSEREMMSDQLLYMACNIREFTATCMGYYFVDKLEFLVRYYSDRKASLPETTFDVTKKMVEKYFEFEKKADSLYI